jgi:mannose-6-phosphate isomerase-like protein (cupin superfamily)
MQTELSKSAKAPARPQEETLSVIGHDITIKLGADQTDGTYSVFELIVPPEVGTGLHIDQDWDEYWHVMEGRFAFTLNGQRKELPAGGFAFGPRGIPHSFRNVGETVGKLVMVTVPSGLEAFFRHVHQASIQGRPDKEEFVRIMRTHHIEPA